MTQNGCRRYSQMVCGELSKDKYLAARDAHPDVLGGKEGVLNTTGPFQECGIETEKVTLQLSLQ